MVNQRGMVQQEDDVVEIARPASLAERADLLGEDLLERVAASHRRRGQLVGVQVLDRAHDRWTCNDLVTGQVEPDAGRARCLAGSAVVDPRFQAPVGPHPDARFPDREFDARLLPDATEHEAEVVHDSLRFHGPAGVGR